MQLKSQNNYVKDWHESLMDYAHCHNRGQMQKCKKKGKEECIGQRGSQPAIMSRRERCICSEPRQRRNSGTLGRSRHQQYRQLEGREEEQQQPYPGSPHRPTTALHSPSPCDRARDSSSNCYNINVSRCSPWSCMSFLSIGPLVCKDAVSPKSHRRKLCSHGLLYRKASFPYPQGFI